jgi:hypothetical protein
MGNTTRFRAHGGAHGGARRWRAIGGPVCAAVLVASLAACTSSDLEAINEVLDGLNEGLSGMPTVSTPYVSQPSYRASTPTISQPSYPSVSTPYVSQPSYRVSTPSTNKPSDITW